MARHAAVRPRDLDKLIQQRMEQRAGSFLEKLDQGIHRIRKRALSPPNWAKGGVGAIEDFERELAVLGKFVQRVAPNGVAGATQVSTLPAPEPGPDADSKRDGSPRGVLDGLRETLYRLRMVLRSEKVDEYGLDPVFFEFTKPLIEFFYRKYFRVDVQGLEHVPSTGRGLLVGNHSGVIPYDGMMVSAAVMFDHPSGRIPRFLAEDMFSNYPFLSPMFTKGGTVRACRENAERLLRDDQLVAVFPEGTKGIGKLYRDRYHLQRFGRGGFIHLALKTGAPLIPTAVVGAEESMPMIAKSDFLARLLGIPYFPITPNMFVFGLLGSWIAFPTKWTVQFGAPIYLPGNILGSRDEDLRINRFKEDLRQRIQDMINDLVKRRKSVWFS